MKQKPLSTTTRFISPFTASPFSLHIVTGRRRDSSAVSDPSQQTSHDPPQPAALDPLRDSPRVFRHGLHVAQDAGTAIQVATKALKLHVRDTGVVQDHQGRTG
jgi:hypothetical protein